MSSPISIAISTCPNDTFAFHGLMTGRVDSRGLDFAFELGDVEELNQGLFEGRYDVAKSSFHAALALSDQVGVMRSGSALGFGVGPLLLAANEQVKETIALKEAVADLRVLCPGRWTTASLLFRLFYPAVGRIEQVIFSDIMPALTNGSADLGVCIHEGRFTWQQMGLACISDLGGLWEAQTNAPLPLGGIVGRRSLSDEKLTAIQAAIKDSIEYGLANRTEALQTMKQYAQEFDEDVLFAHVDLYVNDWTIDLGDIGERSLRELHKLAVQSGAISKDQPQLEVLG